MKRSESVADVGFINADIDLPRWALLLNSVRMFTVKVSAYALTSLLFELGMEILSNFFNRLLAT